MYLEETVNEKIDNIQIVFSHVLRSPEAKPEKRSIYTILINLPHLIAYQNYTQHDNKLEEDTNASCEATTSSSRL